MTYTIVPTKDRADWLAKRREGIGASDIAGILGISPYTTPFQVWASKVAELPEIEETEAMRWGKILENLILDEWGAQNWPVTDRGLLLRNDEVPYFMATPDGLVTWEGFAVVEAKNDQDWRWAEVPAHYQAQVQWQLVVTGYPRGYMAVLHAGRHLETYPIEADPDIQAEMVSAAHDFWKLVETDEAPPVEAADNTIMAHLWPTHTEQAVEIDHDTAAELYEAKRDRDAGTQRYETATATVKALLGDADTAVVDQQIVAKWVGEPRKFYVKGDGLWE